jgi:hypothetical protein
MATQRGVRSVLERYPQLRKGIELVQRDILGHLPKNHGVKSPPRTGYNRSIRQLQGVYLNQYYGESIDKYARMVQPGFLNEVEERRQIKLTQLRRRGKGPPKKGSGKRKK